MSKKKEKPYLEFGGNVFYINLSSILEAIKIDTIDSPLPPQLIVEEKVVKKRKSKKVIESNEPPQESMNVEFLPEFNDGIQVDISKWEVLRLMLDAIMNINIEIDDKLGIAGLNNSTPIPFKIAFNTLLKYDILQEEDEE